MLLAPVAARIIWLYVTEAWQTNNVKQDFPSDNAETVAIHYF